MASGTTAPTESQGFTVYKCSAYSVTMSPPSRGTASSLSEGWAVRPGVSQVQQDRGLATHSALDPDVWGGRQKVRLFWDPGCKEDKLSFCWGLSFLLCGWGQ